MNLMPFADLLESAGYGMKGTDIFINSMPVEANDSILLRQKLTGTPINYDLPGYFRTRFNLVIRSHSYESGETLIKSVTKSLTVSNLQLDELYLNFSRPTHQPVAFPLSKGNNLEFQVEFEVCYVDHS